MRSRSLPEVGSGPVCLSCLQSAVTRGAGSSAPLPVIWQLQARPGGQGVTGWCACRGLCSAWQLCLFCGDLYALPRGAAICAATMNASQPPAHIARPGSLHSACMWPVSSASMASVCSVRTLTCAGHAAFVAMNVSSGMLHPHMVFVPGADCLHWQQTCGAACHESCS